MERKNNGPGVRFYEYSVIRKKEIPNREKVTIKEKGITKEEFKILVAKYGYSNYDRTMGKLDKFKF